MKIVFTLLLLATSAFGIGLRDVPRISVADYTPSLRDPFVDFSVTQTLVGTSGSHGSGDVARPLESYRADLEALFLKENKVNGIALSSTMSLAVVNGKTVAPGAMIRIAIPEALSKELLNTTQYYGLGLEPQIEANLLQGEIAEITKAGLSLKLGGASLHLPYRKNLSTKTD